MARLPRIVIPGQPQHIIALATDDPLPNHPVNALAEREPDFVRVGLANIAAIANLALAKAATL